jgi:hypothetical protein
MVHGKFPETSVGYRLWEHKGSLSYFHIPTEVFPEWNIYPRREVWIEL